MQNIELNNGVEMPILGFGVFRVPAEETERAVSDALAAGYRHIDTAAGYENEAAVGRAIRTSGIPRDELFITTKLWIQDAGENPARLAFERSLERLGLDHLDLYLIHQPFGDVYGSWRAMQALYGEGRVRAIGVSNFYPDRLVDLVDHNEIVPAVNQIETHPYFQRTADQQVMQDRGVQIESWGPLAQGQSRPFTDPALGEIAQAHAKTIAQVVLRWLIQRDVVVIPKSVRPERMAENLDVFDYRWAWDHCHTLDRTSCAAAHWSVVLHSRWITRGRGWSATAARGEFRRLAAAAGVRRRFAPHQPRHAHAIEMAHEGIPLPIIQRQLGHAHLWITSIYLQGIDTREIIETVHHRRPPVIPASAGLRP